MGSAAAGAALAALAALAVARALPDYRYENILSNVMRNRPRRGCAVLSSPWRMECALPAGPVVLAADRDATYLKLTCQANGERVGSVDCGELQPEASGPLRSYRRATVTTPLALGLLEMERCELTGQLLQCVLGLVEAREVATAKLKGVLAPLLPDHLLGLESLLHLKLLDIGNNVTSLPYDALAALPALRQLEVHGGSLRLSAGGEDWAPLRQLQTLQLVDGKMRALPSGAFLRLEQLRNLSLSSNRIQTVDENAFEGLSRLEYLWLQRNMLRALPARVLLPTPRLRVLNLYDNRVPALPQLAHLQHLEEISVSNTNEVPLLLHNDTFGGLPALRKVTLESCGITAAPARLLSGCRALTTFSLRQNKLLELPADLLVEQAALLTLDLGRNRLTALPPALLAGAKALQKLDLSENNFSHLDSQVFAGLRIQELSLSHNNLQKFVDENFRIYNHHLKVLDLSYNAIRNLTYVDLQLLWDAKVDVRHNKISRVTQVPAALLDRVSKSKFLLDGNPFRCDCHMYDFLASLREPEVAQLYEMKNSRCAAPPSLNSKLLSDVPLDALLCTLEASDCPASCTCAWRSSKHTLELDCPDAPRTLPSALKFDVQSVRLRLRSTVADVATLPSAVRVLDISGLGLASSPSASSRVSDLTVDLSRNNLTSAPLALLEANCKVLLAGNELACDCAHRESLVGLRRHWARVVDGDAVRCADGQRVEAKDLSVLCAGRDALSLGLCSGLVLALLVLVAFRYRTEMRLLLSRCELFEWLLQPDDRMLLKTYDAFVSFSHHDDEFVREVLVPALEGGRRPLRLCLHYRDWEVGDLIPEQIDRSVRESWRTIVVLSEDFVRSMWGRHEFRAAHGLERVIVLVLGDALRAMEGDNELRAYKKTHTCIMASHPLVWDRIRDAVYRSKCSAAAATESVGGNSSADRVPRGAEDKGTKAAGGLDVQLLNGQLVNVAS